MSNDKARKILHKDEAIAMVDRYDKMNFEGEEQYEERRKLAPSWKELQSSETTVCGVCGMNPMPYNDMICDICINKVMMQVPLIKK